MTVWVSCGDLLALLQRPTYLLPVVINSPCSAHDNVENSSDDDFRHFESILVYAGQDLIFLRGFCDF